MSSPISIGFLWHSPCAGNLGIGALSIANILLVASAAEDVGAKVEYFVFGPRLRESVYPSSVLPHYRYFPLSNQLADPRHLRRAVSALRSCALVFDIGSGDSFSDIYGSKRFLKVLFGKLLVPRPQARLVLSPQTIGPFRNPVFRMMAGRVMAGSRRVFARDQESFNFASSLWRSPNLSLSTDVAFSLPYSMSQSPDPNRGGRMHIGFNISGLLFSGGYTQQNQFNLQVDYPALVRQLLRRFKESGYRVTLVPHVFSGPELALEDDARAANQLAREFPGVHLAPRFADAVQAKSYISRFDFFLGSRMHATIAALSTGVPVVPLGYSRKFGGLYETLGFQHSLDLRSMANSEVVEEVTRRIQNPLDIQKDVAVSRARAVALLSPYQEFLLTAINEQGVTT